MVCILERDTQSLPRTFAASKRFAQSQSSPIALYQETANLRFLPQSSLKIFEVQVHITFGPFGLCPSKLDCVAPT